MMLLDPKIVQIGIGWMEIFADVLDSTIYLTQEPALTPITSTQQMTPACQVSQKFSKLKELAPPPMMTSLMPWR